MSSGNGNSDLLEIQDGSGIVRKCGALPPDLTKVKSAFGPGGTQYWEDIRPDLVCTEAEIVKMLTANSSTRTPRRTIFSDPHWVKEGDQKQVGSCNGWQTTSIASKLRWLRGIQDGLVLSGSYLYSLINGGNDNGSALQDDIGAMTTYGACPASMCDANTWHRNQTKQFDSEAAKHKQLDWHPVKSLDGFWSAIYWGALGGACLDANNAFANYNGNGIAPTGSGIGNHATHVDDVVIYKGSLAGETVNNWGLGWGSNGRGLVNTGTYQRSFQNHQFYVAFSTAEADPVQS